ncbi:hypothetical protein Hanom_Chr04g00372841 [Helianthus anomalus]
MYHVVALIAERQRGTCTNQRLPQLSSVMCLMSIVQGLMQNYYRPGVSPEAASLFLRGRGKQWRSLRFPTRERKSPGLKISIKPGGQKRIYPKFLYENYILSATERKVRGVGRPLPPLKSFAHGGKAVYILPSSDPTLALLLTGYTEYDDDDANCTPSKVINEQQSQN